MRCSLAIAFALSFVSSALAAPVAVPVAPFLAKRNCNPMPSKVDPKIRDFLYTYVRKKTSDPKILKVVMTTAITESLVNNLNCGDQESHGIFQQKAPGYGWGTVAQTMDPAHATDKFLEALAPIYGKNKGAAVNVLAQTVQQAEAGDQYWRNMAMADDLIEQARKSTGDSGNNDDDDEPTSSAPAPKPTSTKTPKPTSTPGNGGAINVPVPAPTATSTPDDGANDDEDCDDSLPPCDKYYVPVSGDNCYKVAAKFSLSLKQFYQLNADLDDSCSNLYRGKQYCVAASDVN